MNLKLEDIAHNFGKPAFRFNVDMQDEICGIFGFSGAGKTTLMNIISGILTPKSGRITFNGRVFFDGEKGINLPPNQRNVGVVFQDNLLFPHLNIKQNLRFSEPYTRAKRKLVKSDEIIELLDIGKLLDKKPRQLSGGEKQRVAIGRTLLSQPDLLLLDEPFSNLDRKRRKQIISYLLKINDLYDIPMLLISHDLEDMLKLSHSFIVVDDGEIKASGNYLEIADSGKVPELIEVKRFINISELYYTSTQISESLNLFSLDKNLQKPLLKTNTQSFEETSDKGQKVRLGIYPDDIALTDQPVQSISIQNQLQGRVTKIRSVNNSFFVTVDCGIELVAEVTRSAIEALDIHSGKMLYCLIKAKAIEVVHIS